MYRQNYRSVVKKRGRGVVTCGDKQFGIKLLLYIIFEAQIQYFHATLMRSPLFNIPDTYRQLIFLICVIACTVFLDPPFALLTGLMIAFTTGHPFIKINKKATTLLLQVSVVCLGFNMNFEHAMQAGKEGFLFTVATIGVTLLAGYIIGKQLKIDKNTSLLISNGTAICGGSAIAAVAPVIKANDEQISVSLGTIFILNSIALFIFPTLG